MAWEGVGSVAGHDAGAFCRKAEGYWPKEPMARIRGWLFLLLTLAPFASAQFPLSGGVALTKAFEEGRSLSIYDPVGSSGNERRTSTDMSWSREFLTHMMVR